MDLIEGGREIFYLNYFIIKNLPVVGITHPRMLHNDM